MSDITSNVSVSSQPMYQFYQTQCMYDITSTICMKSYVIRVTSHPLFMTSQHFFMTSSPLYMTSHPLYLTLPPLHLCHHTHSINDITANICMILHPVYVWHPIHYIYDIIPSMYDITTLCVEDTTLSICMTSFALQVTLHPPYHNKPQYLWFHIHLRHDITPTLLDIPPTVSLSSQPLQWYHTHFCMTSLPLYVWHHMHFI